MNPLLNSADEYFESPISRTFNDIAGQFTYRTVEYNPVFAASFMDHVNDGMFLGFAPGIAKLVAFDAEEIENDDGNNQNISIEKHFRSDGWKRSILDQGYREFTGVDENGKPKYFPIETDKNGKLIAPGATTAGDPIRSPMQLDGNGRVKQKGAPSSFLLYEIYGTANFDLLNLG